MSGTSSDSSKSETAIAIRPDESKIVREEDQNSKPKSDISETIATDVVVGDEQNACKIDIGSSTNGQNVDEDAKKVCRICHLSPEHPSRASDLIQLGCSCKDELGLSHRHCAETWFKRKGNRVCEICGKYAKNIKRTEDDGVAVERNEIRRIRLMATSTNSDSHSDGSCCCRQPFCNFILACMVIGFMLPWFVRNMFINFSTAYIPFLFCFFRCIYCVIKEAFHQAWGRPTILQPKVL